MRTCIILNPVAGSARDLAEVATCLASLGDVRILLTARDGDAEQLAREALDAGIRRFVAGGGDGTVHGVLNGIGPALAEVEFGILPLGTGNDYAASVGMRLPPPESVDALRQWRTHPVDVVRLRATAKDGPHERLMLNGSAAGFVQAVGAATDQHAKRGILGSLSYVLSAATSIGDLQPYEITVRADGRETHVRGISTLLTSGRMLGGAVPINPSGWIDDGNLELRVIPEMPLADLALLGVSILAGTHESDPRLHFFRASRFELHSDPPMPVNADGEEIGSTPAVYEVLPRALRIVLGPAAPAVGAGELSRDGARNAR